jgi:hypothetical protein
MWFKKCLCRTNFPIFLEYIIIDFRLGLNYIAHCQLREDTDFLFTGPRDPYVVIAGPMLSVPIWAERAIKQLCCGNGSQFVSANYRQIWTNNEIIICGSGIHFDTTWHSVTRNPRGFEIETQGGNICHSHNHRPLKHSWMIWWGPQDVLSGQTPYAGALTLSPLTLLGVGLGWVVRKVRQHPDDHEFESQRWQWIYFPFWFAVDCERW